MKNKSRLPEILKQHEKEVLNDWTKEQEASTTRQKGMLKEGELREQTAEFLPLLLQGLEGSEPEDIQSAGWGGARDALASISRSRNAQGMTASETAKFVFSIKQPLFALLQKEFKNDAKALGEEMWLTNEIIDKLGLYTTEVYQRAREEVIGRQQEELLELSTPVVTLWEGILALPLIGTLDSARTQVVMESLLQKIVETSSDVAIIDITGVPTVDTLVAQHLLKTVTAARLMGADCIISGIRPQIAQTIVHLGVNLGDVTTKATMKDAFSLALKRSGYMVCKTKAATQEKP
jgi:rsbT co-antagonist protein RsbR